MSISRIISNDFFNEPNRVIDFNDPANLIVKNNNYLAENFDSGLVHSVDYGCPNAIELDVNRGLLVNNLDYRDAHPNAEFNEMQLDSFIIDSLGIDQNNPHELQLLKNAYRQTVIKIPFNAIAQCIVASLTELAMTVDYVIKYDDTAHLYRGDDTGLYLAAELKDLNITMIDARSNGKEYGIPGVIAFQFKLTDKGFKLEKIAADNQLLIDLSTKNSTDANEFWYRLGVPEKMRVSPFATYLLNKDVNKNIAYNIRQNLGISRVFDEQVSDIAKELGLLSQHYYEGTSALLSKTKVFWENYRWDEWRELALATAINDLFDEKGDIKKDVYLALNIDGELDKKIKGGVSLEKLKGDLLEGYYSAFIAGPLSNQSDLFNKHFHERNAHLLSSSRLEMDKDEFESTVKLAWMNVPFKKNEPLNIVQYKITYTAEYLKNQIENEKISFSIKLTEFFKSHRPLFAVGLGIGIAVAAAGVIALSVVTLGFAPAALLAIGGAITVGMLSGIAAQLVGGAVIVVGAVATYVAVLGGVIGFTALREKFSNKDTISPSEPVSENSSEPCTTATASDEEHVLSSSNESSSDIYLIRNFNAQPDPASNPKPNRKESSIVIDSDEEGEEDTIGALPRKENSQFVKRQEENLEESPSLNSKNAFKTWR